MADHDLSYRVVPHPTRPELLHGRLTMKVEITVREDLNVGDRVRVVVHDDDSGEVLETLAVTVEKVTFPLVREKGTLIGAERLHTGKQI